MDEMAKELLIKEILSANTADFTGHILEWQSLNQQSEKILGSSTEDIASAVETIGEAKTASVKAFLERKKMFIEALKELD